MVEADAGAALVEGATPGFEPAEGGDASAAKSTVEQVNKAANRSQNHLPGKELSFTPALNTKTLPRWKA